MSTQQWRSVIFAGLFFLSALLSVSASPAASQPGQTVPPTPLFDVIRVDVASDGTPANGHSHGPSISADGRYVAFASQASNLVVGDTNDKSDVFLRDTQTGATTRVSFSSDGSQHTDNSSFPSISADGRYVAYSIQTGLPKVFVYDTQTGMTVRVSGVDRAQRPRISADGHHVAFEYNQIYIHDIDIGQTTLVSRASDGTPGNDSSSTSAISADGRFIAFASMASNLVPGENYESESDIFIHDRQSQQTIRVSVGSDYAQSMFPSINGDGRYIAFQSGATNLAPDDKNGKRDIFVYDILEAQMSRVSLALF